MKKLTIKPGFLTLEDLKNVYRNNVKIELDKSTYKSMESSLKFVETVVAQDKPVYGVNTGIGLFANTRIPIDDLRKHQRFVVISHAVGVGPPADDGLVRLIIVLKINSLGLGYSGIRPEVIDALMELVNKEVYPHIPVKGSVGASGDLAPLSHLVSVLLGDGKAKFKGEYLPALDALARADIKPIILGPREGVALINGTQVSTAFALKGLFDADDLFVSGIVCGALSLEAALGSRKSLNEKVHKVKVHSGQQKTAAAYRYLLKDHSGFSESHKDCPRVQDPYSLRCQAQVMGACLTQIQNATDILLTEANSSSDNPVFFPELGEVISAGNFHAEHVAFAADNLALALAEIGSLSERRISLLMDKHLSGLPAFLVHDGGVNTGFMTAQVTAAALVSENKSLAFPASVDSIPTSGNQEDHVSMAPAAGKRLWEMAENVKNILAIEFLCAVQGLDLREGLKTTASLELARKALREKVLFLNEDRFMAPDIEAASKLIQDGCLSSLMPRKLLE